MNLYLKDFILASGRWMKDNCLFLAMVTCLLGAMALAYTGGYNHKEVTINIEGEEPVIVTTWKGTVGEVLEEANISKSIRDEIYPSPGEEIRKDMTIYMRRSFPVYVMAGEDREVIWTTGGEVQEILDGLELGDIDCDMVDTPLHEPLEGRMEVVIPNLEREYLTKLQEVPFSTVRRSNPSMDKGMYQVIQEGKPGLQENQIEVLKLDGEEIERKVLSSSVLEAKKDRLKEVGTNITISRGNHTLRFREALEVYATAYCSCSHCTGNYDGGITATGTAAVPGKGTRDNPHLIAVDPGVIPLNSLVYMEGLGFGRAKDTGGAIRGNRIDILMENHGEALSFGRRNIKVYIIE